MELLGNTTFQFVISISPNLLLGIITLWLALRRTDKLPLAYTTISQVSVNPDDEDIKAYLSHFDFSLWGTLKPNFQVLTFKLWNSGREPVKQDDENKPWIVEFNGVTILACLQVVSYPVDLDFTCEVVEGNLHLKLPSLQENESLTVQILVPIYLYNSLPDIRVRGHAPKPMLKANNIRLSKEMSILGLFYLFATLYMFFSLRSQQSSPLKDELWVSLAGGLLFIAISWADRKWPPSPELLPSMLAYSLFLEFIRALPVFIPIGIVAFVVYLCFGRTVLLWLFLISMMIFMPFCLWYVIHTSIIGCSKRNRKNIMHFW